MRGIAITKTGIGSRKPINNDATNLFHLEPDEDNLTQHSNIRYSSTWKLLGPVKKAVGHATFLTSPPKIDQFLRRLTWHSKDGRRS
jgi:hypothetical protein